MLAKHKSFTLKRCSENQISDQKADAFSRGILFDKGYVRAGVVVQNLILQKK